MIANVAQPHLETWMHMLDKVDGRRFSDAQIMNFHLNREIEAGRVRRRDAMKSLSQSGAETSFESVSWIDASEWLLEDMHFCFSMDSALLRYLSRFNLVAIDAKTWGSSASPPNTGLAAASTALQLEIESHFEGGGHTWYVIEVCLCIRDSIARFRAPRRLCQLRSLHDFVSLDMGPHYREHFEATPFARHTAPSGTTARLRAWFSTLSKLLNERKVSPRVAASTLEFIFAEAFLPEKRDTDDSALEI